MKYPFPLGETLTRLNRVGSLPGMPPNILMVIADQLAPHAVSCFGSDWCSTPNIDALAGDGLAFDRVYTPCPLCQPARAAFWTGLFPHQSRVLSNGLHWHDPLIPGDVPTLGSLLTEAGYACHHFGKTHDHGGLRGFTHHETGSTEIADEPGFATNRDTFLDVAIEEAAIAWLSREGGDQPWCCAVDFNNPHNICGFVAENTEGCIDVPLPELPANFAVKDLETRPLPVQYLCCSHRRQMQAARWSDRQWRQYRAAYRHFTEDLDNRVGQVLEAMRRRADFEQTLILFFADHGDGLGAHRLATKHTTFYEETTRVPFIAAGKGVSARGVAAGNPLISLLDLVPTLCELAGRPSPAALPGKSIKAAFNGAPCGHPYVVSQWHTEWGTTVEPGRMLRTDRYKYTRYREGEGEELFDLIEDPGESRNLVGSPSHQTVLREHRDLFSDYCRKTQDPFFELDWKADDRWRSHLPGYENHTGTCAPDAEG